MQVCRHTGQCSQRLALAAGRDKDGILFLIIFQMFNVDQCIFRNINVSKFARRADDIDHASALDHYLTSIVVCRIDDLLDTVYVGSKRRNDDPVVLVLCKNRIKGLADGALRHRKSRTDRVGTVTHQRQHAFLSKLGKTLQIRRFAEYRCVIDLEVAGVDDNASRGEDRKRRCICDTVVRLDELNPKTSEIDGLSVLYDLAADGLHHIMLF